MSQRRIYLAAAAALVMAVVLNWRLGGTPDGRPSAPPLDPSFDYALDNFTAWFHDAEGRLDLELSGPRLEHSTENRRIRVTEPHFRAGVETAPWSGWAMDGELDREGNELTLSGDVRLLREEAGGTLEIESGRMHYLRGPGIARSPGPARILRPGTEIRGGTLTVWLNDDRMELKQHVEAEYRGTGSGHDSGPDSGNGPDLPGPRDGQR